ncbi:hypothetical protein FQR65_LT08442 [Abscondita terminalis]|nr:hypothetical protein FQR65_LT08442 [Abscondita terminalis]
MARRRTIKVVLIPRKDGCRLMAEKYYKLVIERKKRKRFEFQPLILDELIEELEDPKRIPESPTNANEDNTDEHSGEEDDVNMMNLPRTQLLAEAEKYGDSDDYDSEDHFPLSYTERSESKNFWYH